MSKFLGEKLVKMFRFRTFYFLAIDYLDFTRKNLKNSSFVKIEFLGKNLTFGIVCTLKTFNNL